jgi:hypothetical protein
MGEAGRTQESKSGEAHLPAPALKGGDKEFFGMFGALVCPPPAINASLAPPSPALTCCWGGSNLWLKCRARAPPEAYQVDRVHCVMLR